MEVQNIVAKIQSLFDQRMQEYEHTTADILKCVNFAVDGIKKYFLTIHLRVHIEDITIISDVFVFTTVVENTLVDRPQMFNVGIPADLILTQSTTKILNFLITAANATQQDIKSTIPQPPVSKKYLH